MKNVKTEVRDAAPFPICTLCVFVIAFAVATVLCFWHSDAATALALLCLCPMTLIVVIGHIQPKTCPARIELSRIRALGKAG